MSVERNDEEHLLATGGSSKSVITALLANLGIAIAKFIGFLITSSSSMLAESIHSLADTTNQGLLLLGGKRAVKDANDTHQFGYGRERYFWSFLVALLLFSVGAGYAIVEGIEKIRHPHETEKLWIAVIILVVAIGLEAFAFATAFREAQLIRGSRTWWQFIRTTRNPELPVVLLEDSGAMFGLVVALFGVGMSQITDDPVWDGIATLIIGLILGAIAILLAIEMKSLLIGETATDENEAKIDSVFYSHPAIEQVIDIKTQHIGPEEILVAARAKFDENLSGSDLARAIDDVHAKLKVAVPMCKFIYIEPDLHGADSAQSAQA